MTLFAHLCWWPAFVSTQVLCTTLRSRSSMRLPILAGIVAEMPVIHNYDLERKTRQLAGIIVKAIFFRVCRLDHLFCQS